MTLDKYCLALEGETGIEEALSPCLWKLTIEDNKQGRGTSFDIANLNEAAKKCLYCNDFYQGSRCEGYIPDE